MFWAACITTRVFSVYTFCGISEKNNNFNIGGKKGSNVYGYRMHIAFANESKLFIKYGRIL